MRFRSLLAASGICLSVGCNVGPHYRVSDDDTGAEASLSGMVTAEDPDFAHCLRAPVPDDGTWRVTRMPLEDGRTQVSITIDAAAVARSLFSGAMMQDARMSPSLGEGVTSSIAMAAMVPAGFAQQSDMGILELRTRLAPRTTDALTTEMGASCGSGDSLWVRPETPAELVGCVIPDGARAGLVAIDFTDPELSVRMGLAADIHSTVVTEAGPRVPRLIAFASPDPLLFDMTACNWDANAASWTQGPEPTCRALAQIARDRLDEEFHAWMFGSDASARLERAIQERIARILLEGGLSSGAEIEYVGTIAVNDGSEVFDGIPQMGGIRVVARVQGCG